MSHPGSHASLVMQTVDGSRLVVEVTEHALQNSGEGRGGLKGRKLADCGHEGGSLGRRCLREHFEPPDLSRARDQSKWR